MSKLFVSLSLLTVMLPLSVFACPADGKHEPPRLFDPETAGDLVNPKTLTPIEERLNGIIVPEIDFRCANTYDIISFYDSCVKEYGGEKEGLDRSRIRIVVDRTSFGDDVPLNHFSSLKMPLLFALRLTCALGDLEYRIEEHTVTVFKPKKKDGPTTKSRVSAPSQPEI